MNALYPASFDPITKGHMNIIEQARDLFDMVYIAVMQNPSKGEGFFTIQERIALIEQLYANIPGIKIVTGLVSAQIAREYNCKVLIRGLRNSKDFEYEKELASINRVISNDEVKTICLFPTADVQDISSSTVRSLFALNLNVENYVVPEVEAAMARKRTYGSKNIG